LVGGIVYLAASFVLWRLLLKEPPPNGTAPAPLALAAPPREGLRHPGRRAATGAASLLVVATVVNAGKPGTLTTHVMLAVWAVASVIGMLFIGRAPLIRRVVTRACLAVGVQGVILPLGTLVSFIVAGTRPGRLRGHRRRADVEVLDCAWSAACLQSGSGSRVRPGAFPPR